MPTGAQGAWHQGILRSGRKDSAGPGLVRQGEVLVPVSRGQFGPLKMRTSAGFDLRVAMFRGIHSWLMVEQRLGKPKQHTPWIAMVEDDELCQDLCAVLTKLLTPVPEQRPSSPELLQLPEMQRLAKRVRDELDEPILHREEGDLQAHLIHRALDRLESVQDLDLLREDVHRAVLCEDPNAPQLLQMLLQLPTFRGALSQPAASSLPGWAHPAQDALCRSWSAADFKDLRELLLCLQAFDLPIATWPPGSAEELLEELGRGATLSLRQGPETQLISIAHELCLDIRQDSGASELCLLELHSLDSTADGRVVFPQLRHRLPTWLFNPKDGQSWLQRLHEALEALQLSELVEEEEFAVPESSIEFRPSQSFPGLWTRHHRWTLRLPAAHNAAHDGAFTTRRRRWAWLAPEESCALRKRQQQMGVGQVRYEDLCKVSEEGQTLLHAACVSRHAARLLRLVSDLLPYVQVSRWSLSDFLPLELPKVPKVFNAGPDGMPHLPDVDTLLENYQDVNHDLNFAGGKAGFAEHLASVELDVQGSSVDSFSEHLAKVQTQSRQHIAELTAKYDAKLQEQEKQNQVLVRGNAHLAREILTARQQSEEMQKQVLKQQALVRFRRQEIRALQQQMARGEKFLQQQDKDPLKEAQEAEDATEEADGISFLEVSRVRRPAVLDAKTFLGRGAGAVAKLDVTQGLDEDADATPEAALEAVAQPEKSVEEMVQPNKEDNQIINLLTEDLKKLHKAETEIKSNLKKMFHQSIEAGKERHQALVQEKEVLTKELESTQASLKVLTEKSKKLQSAVRELELSLKKGGAFFRDMQKVSVAPVKKVPALLKKVLSHFREPPKPLAQDHQGRTPLWLAASRADRKAVQQLLHFRSDPEATDRRGVSVLAAAAETRRDQTLGTVKELLEGGAMPMEVLKKLDKEERSDVLSKGILKVLVKSALAGTVWRRIAECIMTLAGGKVSRSYLEEILHRCQVDVLVAKHLLAMLEGPEPRLPVAVLGSSRPLMESAGAINNVASVLANMDGTIGLLNRVLDLHPNPDLDMQLKLLDQARQWLKALEENNPDMQELVELMLKKSDEMHTVAQKMQSSKLNARSSTALIARQIHEMFVNSAILKMVSNSATAHVRIVSDVPIIYCWRGVDELVQLAPELRRVPKPDRPALQPMSNEVDVARLEGTDAFCCVLEPAEADAKWQDVPRPDHPNIQGIRKSKEESPAAQEPGEPAEPATDQSDQGVVRRILQVHNAKGVASTDGTVFVHYFDSNLPDDYGLLRHSVEGAVSVDVRNMKQFPMICSEEMAIAGEIVAVSGLCAENDCLHWGRISEDQAEVTAISRVDLSGRTLGPAGLSWTDSNIYFYIQWARRAMRGQRD
eukprot:s178_g7.t1